MPLVDELLRTAAADGERFERLSAGGQDRYGPVAAMLSGHGHISGRDACTGGFELIIWYGEDIVAAGLTDAVADIAGTMLGWQRGTPVQELRRRLPYLHSTDAVDVLWHLLIAHGDEENRAPATAVKDEPALRRLRPWIGHGTVHLLHRRDRIGATRYGLAFYRPADSPLFRLDLYGAPRQPAESLPSVVVRATAAAATWD